MPGRKAMRIQFDDLVGAFSSTVKNLYSKMYIFLNKKLLEPFATNELA